MDPILTSKFLDVPFAGTGTTLERNALIGVIRNLIKDNKYTVDYILDYCTSAGYSYKMVSDVFTELTGLSPKLIVNNNEYYKMPSYVPNMCIAWGEAKTKKDVAYYIVPFDYGYVVMEKDEVNAPVPVIEVATIPEAIDELKKVAKKIQTLHKIITEKLLETEDIQTSADDTYSVNEPYCSDPVFVLKKNFKDKVIGIKEFERQARQLVAEDKISVEKAEDLISWKDDLIDEDESYNNEVLEHTEKWNQLKAEEDEEVINIDTGGGYLQTFEKGEKYEYGNYLVGEQLYQFDIDDDDRIKGLATLNVEDLINNKSYTIKFNDDFDKLEWFVQDIKDSKTKKEIEQLLKSKAKAIYSSDNMIEYDLIDEDYFDSFDYIYNLLLEGDIRGYKARLDDFTEEELVDYLEWASEHDIDKKDLRLELSPKRKPSISEYKEIAKNMKEEGKTRTQIINYLQGKIQYEEIKKILDSIYNKKQSSKKITAEEADLDDLMSEESKDEVQEEMEQIKDTPVSELLSEQTPADYFDKASQEDKVDTINDVVSKCIDKFSEKFKDFEKYEVKILSYNTKVLGDYTPNKTEMIEDEQINANAILQVILQITNNADETEMKKALAVFSVTNGKLRWTGTIRGENDEVIAFTEEGLDSLFEVEEVKDEELEDII